MVFNKFNDVFHKTSQKMNELNNDYQKMSRDNKKEAIEIKESIKSKSKDFQARKKERNKQFDFIHNK